jgi:hypothetical protein
MNKRVWLSLLVMIMGMVARADAYHVSIKGNYENLVTTENNAYEAIDNKQIEPCLVNADSFDFHLKADSPAINAGSADRAPKTEFDGKHRPQGDKVDIGEYELLPAIAVPRWQMHEFELHGRSYADNPFLDAALIGEFTSPSGKMLIIEGYHAGGDTWRLRFTPDQEGRWRYLFRGEGVELLAQGSLRCVAPESHGFIRIHPDNPYAFAYADGTPFFPMGDTCYGLYSDSSITTELRTQYLKTRRSQRFNFVRLGVIHSPTHGQTDPNYWPWGGTPDKPDFDRFNPKFFQGLDAVLAEMQAMGMNAELIVLNYYLPPFTDERAWTLRREQQWLRYIIARYAAFPNLFLWTIANEYETHPDGRYRLDQPDDPDWARATARFIKQHDPYQHLVTVHPVISASTHGNTPNDPYDLPWRIGEIFGKDDAIDVLSQQTGQSGKGVVWDGQLQCWTGDVPDLVGSLRADRRYRRPVLNTENGYEYLRGYPTEKKQVHHTDKVRHSAWRIVCAGGYFAAGFNGTIGHSDFWNRIDAPNHYTFAVRDEGAAGQLGILYDFFASLPFWRMQPFDGVAPNTAVALAEPGRVYVIYLPHGGEVIVELTANPGPFASEWIHPVDGTVTPGNAVTGGDKRVLKAPFNGEAVVHLWVSVKTRPTQATEGDKQ